MDCTPPGSSVPGISQARILEGACHFLLQGSSQPRDLEEEKKKKGYEKIFEEIIVEIFPNMEKEIVNQVQEAQRVPYRINPKETRQDTY